MRRYLECTDQTDLDAVGNVATITWEPQFVVMPRWRTVFNEDEPETAKEVRECITKVEIYLARRWNVGPRAKNIKTKGEPTADQDVKDIKTLEGELVKLQKDLEVATKRDRARAAAMVGKELSFSYRRTQGAGKATKVDEQRNDIGLLINGRFIPLEAIVGVKEPEKALAGKEKE